MRAGASLDCVTADIMGKCGRDMLDALVAGTTDPDVLAELARRQMGKKMPQLREALVGDFGRLCCCAPWSVPGAEARKCILAEIGADMSRFASARHLASWAGQCPGNDQSAGKRRSGKTRAGSKWLDFALEEAAMATIR